MVARNREGERQVRRGVGHLHPAGNAREHVGRADGNAAELFEKRKNNRKPLRVDTCGHPLGNGESRLVHKRLRLEEERPRALERAAHDTPGRRRSVLLQKYLARVRHRLKPVARHLEHAYLVGRPEAVLDGAQQAVLVVAVALEVDDSIHHVLEDARARNLAILRHMPDEDGNAPRILREHHQIERAFAKLRRAARSAREIALVDRLYGIDDHDLRLDFLRVFHNLLEARLAQEEHVGTRNVQAFAPKLHLAGALFPAHIERLHAGGCHRGERRQNQRGLANPGIATDEHQGTWRKPATQHAVEFRIGGAQPPRVFRGDVAQRHDLVDRTAESASTAGITRRHGLYRMFLEGVPRPAERALADPLRGGVAAFRTEVFKFFLRFV